MKGWGQAVRKRTEDLVARLLPFCKTILFCGGGHLEVYYLRLFPVPLAGTKGADGLKVSARLCGPTMSLSGVTAASLLVVTVSLPFHIRW